MVQCAKWRGAHPDRAGACGAGDHCLAVVEDVEVDVDLVADVVDDERDERREDVVAGQEEA